MDSELELIRAWFAYLADTRQGYLETLAKLPPGRANPRQGRVAPFLTRYLRALSRCPLLLDEGLRDVSVPAAGG